MIKPLFDRVLIERQQKEETRGGIIIPESAQEKEAIGTVLAVGPGRYGENAEWIDTTVEPGQKVIFVRGAGTEVEHNGQKLLLVKECDIVGQVLEES